MKICEAGRIISKGKVETRTKTYIAYIFQELSELYVRVCDGTAVKTKRKVKKRDIYLSGNRTVC